MTIIGWILFGFITFIIAIVVVALCLNIADSSLGLTAIIIAGLVTIVGVFFGIRWYYSSTASGQRALTDQKSELANGLERTVTVYTADGKVMARYEGRIDIEGNDGGYVIFEYEGKRYTYYNCFVESIAETGP